MRRGGGIEVGRGIQMMGEGGGGVGEHGTEIFVKLKALT